MEEATPDNGKLQKLVDHCLDLYKDFDKSAYRKAKIDEIKLARKVYEQKAEKVSFPWDNAANYILPLTTIAVDNLEPRLVAGLIGTDPIIKFDIEGVDDFTKQVVEVLEDDFNKELKNVSDVTGYARTTVHTILNEGTFYVAPKYDIEKRVIRDFLFDPRNGALMFDEMSEPMTKDFETTIFEGGKFEAVPFTDILCADNLGTQEDWEREPVIRRTYPTYSELMQRRGKLGYMNIGQWLLGEKGTTKLTEEQQTPTQQDAGIEVSGKEVIECIECHLSYPIPLDDETEEKDREEFIEENIVVTIARKSEIIIRIVRQRDLNFNNEKMIKRVRLNPEPGRSYGTGIYGKISSLQDGCSELFNHMINVVIIIMIPFFFYDDKAGMKGKITLRPGQGVNVEDVNGIKIPTFSINPAQYMEFINFFVSLWERLVSISDPQIGRLADREETATAILTAVQEGGIKHNYQSEMFKEEFLSAIKLLWGLYYKNMPYDKTIDFEGQKVLYPRKEMRSPFKFRLTGSTEKANKLLARKESEDLLVLFGQDQLMNQIKLRLDVMKTYGKEKPKDYLDDGVNKVLAAMIAIPGFKEQVIQASQQQIANAQAAAAQKGKNTVEQQGVAA